MFTDPSRAAPCAPSNPSPIGLIAGRLLLSARPRRDDAVGERFEVGGRHAVTLQLEFVLIADERGNLQGIRPLLFDLFDFLQLPLPRRSLAL